MPESTSPPKTDLASLLRPKSIAVVGASANPDSPGHDYLRYLVEFGFAGPVYPLHRREPEMWRRGLGRDEAAAVMV